ncbi:LAETG motif-containing sortase-dependent surface protein [Streptomyces sp. enrichment culture]|uniref:excalibur calcium-binding domain-containing protein n=1 Tax=Streptomyces sp. enrichment culture TaxID=1795815 RepID=UPI003F553B66
MNVFRKPAAVAVAAVALAVVPATAVAHDGTHPFKNCSEAYAAGYESIAKGDDHYGKHLDRDNDGVGCDQPPADFVPHNDDDKPAGGTGKDTGTGSDAGEQGGADLAETGGSSATPYLAAGGAAVLLAGGGVLFAARRRRGDTH